MIPSLSPLLLLAFPLAMFAAMATDLTSMTIPNRLVLGLGGIFVLYALSADWQWDAVAFHLAAGLGALAVGIGCFAAGWMGGGDAKLIAAVALWFGLSPDLAEFALLSSVFGGVLTLVVLLARTLLRPTTGHGSIDRLLDRANGVPYGVALGIAGLATFAQSGLSLPLRTLLDI